MSKPDWKDAPEWAQWLAQDADGWWYWYEVEPKGAFEHEYDAQWGWVAGGKSMPAERLDRPLLPIEPRP